MAYKPLREEIDHRTLKIIIGMIAINLGLFAWLIVGPELTSISASYHYEKSHWPRNIFVGSLFAVASFLFAYNGASLLEMSLSKIAALSALGVALFPCGHNCFKPIPFVHEASAITLFLVLSCFCYIFLTRDPDKQDNEFARRRIVYVICWSAMMISMGILATAIIMEISKDPKSPPRFPRMVFWGELIGLIAFGVSWLVASEALPFLTKKEKRFHPLASQFTSGDSKKENR